MKLIPFGSWLTVPVATVAVFGVVAVVHAEDVQRTVSDHPPSQGDEVAPGRSLSIAEAIDAAVRHSPELASDRAEAGAIDGRSTQAGLWPNPQFDVMVENVAGSGDFKDTERSETTLTLAQPIELGGKRAERRRVIASGRRRLDRQMEAHRLAIVAEVKKRFLKVLLAQEREDLTAEIEGLSSEALRAVEGRVKSGAAASSEGAQVRILVGRSRMDLHLAEHEIVAARRQLAALWGDSAPSFTAVGELEDVAPPPPLEELLPRLERSPELTRWDAEIERRGAAMALARANRIPDVTLSAGARHFNDTDDFAAIFDVAVPLPLFDRNQGSILEAQHMLEMARSQREDTLLKARSELLAAYDEMQMQFERISQLGVNILPEAKKANTETLNLYRRGSANAIDVLAAQRVLFELRDEYFKALADYQAALFDVERLTTAATEETAP